MPRRPLYVCVFSVISICLTGCGGGGGTPPPPPVPSFTSTPPTAAGEGMAYSYTLGATAMDGSAVTFALGSGPEGAALSGDTVTWTPTHAESRVGNAFTVIATTAAGGSATQTWTVTPTGTVNVSVVTSYWTPEGRVDVPRAYPISLAYPSALVPQPDGSLLTISGTQNADLSFSIANVPGGYYWLDLGTGAFYWTATSDFDAGENVVGARLNAASSQATTTFDYAVSGVAPDAAGEFVVAFTDTNDLFLLPGILIPVGNSTTVDASVSIPNQVDWSSIDTLYYVEYEILNSGNFHGIVMGPEFTQTNVSLADQGPNNLAAALSPSPTSSLALRIKGSEWANAMDGIGPGTVTPLFTDYAVVAQPYLTNGFVPVPVDTPPLGSFGLLQPEQGLGLATPGEFCSSIGFPESLAGLQFGLPLIETDVDYGELSYGDPFPAEWPRFFEFCQASWVSLPIPNTATTAYLTVVNREVMPLPSGPVEPMLTAVQSPTLNGGSLYTAANLTTTNVNLNWSAPAKGKPYGYYVRVLSPLTLPTGASFFQVAQYGTAKTSMEVPYLVPGNTYVFVISAEMDANANMETSPGRTKLPNAEASVVSAPVTIASGAMAGRK